MPAKEVLFDEVTLAKEVHKLIREAKQHWEGHFQKLDNYNKRYEAKRSISGMISTKSDDPEKSPKMFPWKNCSDIGIPIEAFVIEGLIPRFMKVCYGSKPIVWITGIGESDIAQAPLVQDAINLQLNRSIKIYRNQKLTFRSTTMFGDGITKCIWEKDYTTKSRYVYYLQDATTGEIVLDPQTQKPYESKSDEDIIDPNTQAQCERVKRLISEPKKCYDAPKLYHRPLRSIIVPKEACTPDINDLDWIADQYERNLDWLIKRIGNVEDGDFDEVEVNKLIEDFRGNKDEKSIPKYHKVLISEWYGKFDVNGDGVDEEIVMFLGENPKKGAEPEARLLTWFISPYPKRPFFHYYIIPKENSFYNIGIPEFLVGLRNLIDAIFNQMIDRGSITNNPPTIVPPTHDSAENPYGPGVQWVSDNPVAFRVLELPKSEQIEFTKLEFLLAMVEKLFGVTDYSLGQESTIASNRTATGIMTIVGEGNVKFDDMIRSLQDVNEDLYDFIVQLDSELLEDDFIINVMEGSENPFRKIARENFVGNFDFQAAGNSININREIEQQRASYLYNTFMNSYGKNPAISPEVIHQVSENLIRSTDARNIKLPSLEAMQQQRIQEMAQAIVMSEQIKRQQLAAGKNPMAQPGGGAINVPGQNKPVQSVSTGSQPTGMGNLLQ